LFQTPLQTDAIFRAASMTKITTSLAAMMLYDRGLLLLDDPVSKYIPAFATMTRAVDSAGATVPCATQITIRHLMAHTSGLTYGFFTGARSQAIQKIYDRTFLSEMACL
jgi:CubicO group peptidase (beta-lactamase class C family)